MNILVIDGQGGRVGRQLVEEILRKAPEADLMAVGTNGIATTSMAKGGAKKIATGENAVLVACRTADIIVGPQGIVVADALFGEVTPKMAAAVGQSEAVKILLPFHCCNLTIIGTQNLTMAELVEKAAEEVCAIQCGGS